MVEQSPALGESDPDQAWMVLKLVNQWVQYADAKVAVTFTFAGVTAGTLYNLVKGHDAHLTWPMAVAAAVCAAAIVVCGICASIALFPRVDGKHVGDSDDHSNPLFFGHIAEHYDDDRLGYTQALAALTKDKDAMTNFIAKQTHGNALVAEAKLKWVNRSIKCALVAVAALAAFMLILAAS